MTFLVVYKIWTTLLKIHFTAITSRFFSNANRKLLFHHTVKITMKKEVFAIGFVTIYLVAYAIIAYLGFSTGLVFLLFSLSPFLLVWMVIMILKSTHTPPQSFKDTEEWGYQDVRKEELGVF